MPEHRPRQSNPDPFDTEASSPAKEFLIATYNLLQDVDRWSASRLIALGGALGKTLFSSSETAPHPSSKRRSGKERGVIVEETVLLADGSSKKQERYVATRAEKAWSITRAAGGVAIAVLGGAASLYYVDMPWDDNDPEPKKSPLEFIEEIPDAMRAIGDGMGTVYDRFFDADNSTK